MLVVLFAALTTILACIATIMLYQKRKLRTQFVRKYGVHPKDALEKIMLPVSNRMIEEGSDWSSVEYAMRDVMSDLGMLQGEQAKALSIIHGAWLRGQSFVKKYGRTKAEMRGQVLDRLEQLAHDAQDCANACNCARETLTDLGGYSEAQVTDVVAQVNEWWRSWHRLFAYDSVLERVKEIRANIAPRDLAPQAHAALDGLEQAALSYPQGVPEAVLKDAVLRLDEIATGVERNE